MITKAEELLEEYLVIEYRIELKREEIKSLGKKSDEDYSILGCADIIENRPKTNKISDPTGKLAAYLADAYKLAIENIGRDMSLLLSRKCYILSVIERANLNLEESKYITTRYLTKYGNYEKIEVWKVAQEMNYCESRAGDYKRSAFEKINKVIDGKTSVIIGDAV